jgi:hypothetical protein
MITAATATREDITLMTRAIVSFKSGELGFLWQLPDAAELAPHCRSSTCADVMAVGRAKAKAAIIPNIISGVLILNISHIITHIPRLRYFCPPTAERKGAVFKYSDCVPHNWQDKNSQEA